MSAKKALVSEETREIATVLNETDYRFILAFSMIVIFFIMLIIPIAYGKIEDFKTIAGTMTGFVGTILGYYFGTKKEAT